MSLPRLTSTALSFDPLPVLVVAGLWEEEGRFRLLLAEGAGDDVDVLAEGMERPGVSNKSPIVFTWQSRRGGSREQKFETVEKKQQRIFFSTAKFYPYQ